MNQLDSGSPPDPNGGRTCITETYARPSAEYPMGSYLCRIGDIVQIATGVFAQEFPDHPSLYMHGGPPFVLWEHVDLPWEEKDEPA